MINISNLSKCPPIFSPCSAIHHSLSFCLLFLSSVFRLLTPIGNFAFCCSLSDWNFVFNDFSFEQISCYLTHTFLAPSLVSSVFLPAFNFLCNSLWAETIRRRQPISLTLSSYPKNFPKEIRKKKSGQRKKYLIDTKHPHVRFVAGHFPRGFAKEWQRAFPTLNWMCVCCWVLELKGTSSWGKLALGCHCITKGIKIRGLIVWNWSRGKFN